MSLVFTMNFCSLEANAQAQDFFVRIGAGGNCYWGDDDGVADFSDRIAPTFKLVVGKWFNPFWGVQLGGNYGKMRGACLATSADGKLYNTQTGRSPYSTDEKLTSTTGEVGKYGAYLEKWNYFSIQPEVVYNVSNGMCGYNDMRVWNVLVHAGPHFSHSSANGESANTVHATAGLTSTWKLSRNFQLWADASLTLFDKGFDKVTYRDNMDGMSTISAGISYNFGK